MTVPGRSVLVLGAFGTFGRLIVYSLAQSTDIPIIAAGRRLPEKRGDSRSGIRALAIDSGELNVSVLRNLGPAILIDTVGPFQTRNRRLAETCIGLGIHYLDLADGRDFVQNVGALDAPAKKHHALVVSGASTLPALSSAVIESLAPAFAAIEEIDIGIAPAYSGPRGLATIRSVLGYVGRPVPIWREGAMRCGRGWGDTRRHRYPLPVGLRNLSLIDVPDTCLIPLRYPTLGRLAVRAGHEVAFVHHTLRLLGMLVRIGLIRDLGGHARILQRTAAWFDRFGSDNGAMHVRLRGLGHDDRPLSRTWTLVAENGDGPRIPTLAAVLLTKKLLGVSGYAPIAARGATPAWNLLTLREFENEWRTLAIRTSVTDESRAKKRPGFAATATSHRAT
jgi:hypothetical protein